MSRVCGLPKIFVAILVTGLGILTPQKSYGHPWSVGFFLGLGGTGITKSVLIEDELVDASRSEGPFVVGLSLEKLIHDRLGFAVEHRRGMRLGPLSSGVGFSGVSWRWYYLRNATAVVATDASDYAVVRSWSPYAGGGVGFAQGTITRERNVIPSLSSSGLYAGIKIGLDYQYRKNMILRPEINFSTTLMSSPTIQEGLSEFSLGVSIQRSFPW